MKKLYFKNSRGAYIYICDVGPNDSYYKLAHEDLAVRAPHFKSYYTREWTDDNGTIWLDVGDHCCFYVIKED